MRFGTRRGVASVLALALTIAIAIGGVATARAGLICRTIPREVGAVDTSGNPYYAPPVPYGCYAKDCLGTIAEALGCLAGLAHGCCPGCHGTGCNMCGNTGKCGHCGLCTGAGSDCADPCGPTAKSCGFGGWRCLLHGHDHGDTCGDPCGGGLCSPQSVKKCGFAGHASTVCASVQAPTPQVSPQSCLASSQMACSKAGCLLKMRHFHRMGKGCNACGGNGCGICQGAGMSSGTLCGSCGGHGCGLCGGLGLLHHGSGPGGSGLCSKLLGAPAGLIGKLFHVGEIEYFIGPGGPVPITPGYVPYVVTTRSPRDYFAFPPFSDLDP